MRARAAKPPVVPSVLVAGPLSLVLAAFIGTAPPRAQQPPVRDHRLYRTGVDLTIVTATVRDADGRLAVGLPRDAFEVFEDGEPQPITQFTSERVPLGLGVLLDVSDSMFGQRIADARTAVYRFLFDLLDENDDFFVLAFNHRPHVLTQWTHTPSTVERALASLKPAGGTAVYDAVAEALPLVARRNRERAALLIVSDGDDTASTITLRDLRTALNRSDAFVYGIAIDPADQHAINARVNPAALREVTDPTGGRTEVVRTSGEIAAASQRIADELNHQYVLGYTPPHGADGKFHTIRLRVRRDGYHVRARNGYIADVPSKS